MPISRCVYGHLKKELISRNIREQFENTTMKLARTLTDYEFHGVSVSLRKLSQRRDEVSGQIKLAKERVWERLGKTLDLDSEKELSAALKNYLDLRGATRTKPLSLRHREELAIPHHDVRHVVEYKRLCRKLKHLESISAAAKGNNVYPLFNQVRSSSGGLSSSHPSLFVDN